MIVKGLCICRKCNVFVIIPNGPTGAGHSILRTTSSYNDQCGRLPKVGQWNVELVGQQFKSRPCWQLLKNVLSCWFLSHSLRTVVSSTKLPTIVGSCAVLLVRPKTESPWRLKYLLTQSCGFSGQGGARWGNFHCYSPCCASSVDEKTTPVSWTVNQVSFTNIKFTYERTKHKMCAKRSLLHLLSSWQTYTRTQAKLK